MPQWGGGEAPVRNLPRYPEMRCDMRTSRPEDSCDSNTATPLHQDESASADRRLPTSNISTISIPPTAEEIDRWHQHTTLENFGKTLTKKAKLVFSSETRSRYSNVYVLIIKWEEEDPKLPVSYEIEDLCKVLGGTYRYQIEGFDIPDEKSHHSVREKINAFVSINGDSKDDLKIVYYAGHSRLSKTKALMWSSLRDKRRQECSTVNWTGIQSDLEQADSDVLILLDCCSAGIGNSGEGNGVTQLISACAFDVEANGVGHYSFTKALTIELGLLSSKPSFSVEELYQNVYCRAQHHLAQGLEDERYPAPIHLHLTRERGLQRTIQLAVHRPPQVLNYTDSTAPTYGTSARLCIDRNSDSKDLKYHNSSTSSMRSVLPSLVDMSPSKSTLNDDTSSDSSVSESSDIDDPWPEHAPRIHLGIRLDDNVRAEDLSTDYFTDWLRALPAGVREVRIEAGLTSDPSVLLLTLPVSLRRYLPQRLIRNLEAQQVPQCDFKVPTPVALCDPVPNTGIKLPESFRASCMDYLSYPANLILNASYATRLETYKKRLDKLSLSSLSVGPSLVQIHDFTTGLSGVFERGIILNDSMLQEWLGDPSAPTSDKEIVTKKDPRCRFIFMNGNHASDRLPITRPMLLRILTYHQVMPAYLNFLSGFDPRAAVSDSKFSGFREQNLLANSSPALEMLDLGRSGYNFQFSYNLIAVACDPLLGKDSSGQKWAITQAVFHHQFDVREGTTLWIVAHTNGSLEETLKGRPHINGSCGSQSATSKTIEKSLASSLLTHLLFCQWSIGGWRKYTQWLEEAVQKQCNIAIYTKHHVEVLQRRKDKLHEAIMEMEANTDVLSCLRDFYKRLMENRYVNFNQMCQDDITTFASQIEDAIQDFKSQIACSKILVKIASDRESLILQHLHEQSTSTMEEMTQQMMKIAKDTQKETVSMRIVTVVALVYLPASFVSAFMSTDIVKYRDPSGSNIDQRIESTSMIALQRWLEVTAFLTVVTAFVCWAYLVMSHKAADRKFKTTLLPTHSEARMLWNEKKRL